MKNIDIGDDDQTARNQQARPELSLRRFAEAKQGQRRAAMGLVAAEDDHHEQHSGVADDKFRNDFHQKEVHSGRNQAEAGLVEEHLPDVESGIDDKDGCTDQGQRHNNFAKIVPKVAARLLPAEANGLAAVVVVDHHQGQHGNQPNPQVGRANVEDA